MRVVLVVTCVSGVIVIARSGVEHYRSDAFIRKVRVERVQC